MRAIPLIGRQAERKRILGAFENRGSLLITGARGLGKTRLIESSLEIANPERPFVYISFTPKLRDLLGSLGGKLWAEQDLRTQTSIHLKGLLWRAFEEHPCTIVIDGIERASPPVYRFLQRIYFTRGAGIIASARSRETLGSLDRLFWDPREILELKPLKHAESRRLFDLAMEENPAGGIDLEEVRDRILDAAAGVPGAILTMCRMASEPRYRAGSRVKINLMRIDLAARSNGANDRLESAPRIAAEVSARYGIAAVRPLLASCEQLVRSNEIAVAVLGRFKGGKSSFLRSFSGPRPAPGRGDSRYNGRYRHWIWSGCAGGGALSRRPHRRDCVVFGSALRFRKRESRKREAGRSCRARNCRNWSASGGCD